MAGTEVGQEKSFQKWLAELERPEASWTIQDLIDSGADFTAQNPLTKETYRREPKNEMLVGYHVEISTSAAS